MGLSDPITPQRILDGLPAVFDESTPLGLALNVHRVMLDACMRTIREQWATIRALQGRVDELELRASVQETMGAQQGQAIESLGVVVLRVACPPIDLGPFDLDAGGHQDG